MRCTVRWNPGHWPYVTRCILEHGHKDEHKGCCNTIPNLPGQSES